MKFNSLIPEITVDDLECTKHFYLDILGFVIEYERPEKKFMFLSLEGNQIMIKENNGHWITGTMEYPYGRGINFEMTVRDVDALYQRIMDHGIPVYEEMCTEHYRMNGKYIIQKEFLIQDPDGYLLRFTD